MCEVLHHFRQARAAERHVVDHAAAAGRIGPLPEEEGAVGEIFRGAVPFWIALLAVIVTIAVFPQIATWLPTLAFSAK